MVRSWSARSEALWTGNKTPLTLASGIGVELFSKMKFKLDDKGVSLVEVVVVLCFLGIVFVAMGQLNLMYSKSISAGSLGIRASALAVETMEAVRSIKEENWEVLSDLIPGSVYYLSFSETSKKWSVETSDTGKIGGVFSRSFKISEVYRDYAEDNISQSGALDGNTLGIEANIDWDDRGNDKNLKVKSYLSNL